MDTYVCMYYIIIMYLHIHGKGERDREREREGESSTETQRKETADRIQANTAKKRQNEKETLRTKLGSLHSLPKKHSGEEKE